MVKLMWRMGREAIRYKKLYVLAILSTLLLTVVNLTAPKLLSRMTGIVSDGVTEEGLVTILWLTAGLVALYLLRVLFRYLSNILAHRAAWYLVGDMRTKLYNKLQDFSMGFYHDKQTGDLMSRVINDTRDFEMLYAHNIPDLITNIVTIVGVFTVLLFINWKLALLTCCPIPFIVFSGLFFSKRVQPHFVKAQNVMGGLNAKLQDNISGMQEIQAFVKEKEEAKRVHELVFEHVEAQLRALNLSAIFQPSVEFLSSVGTVVVVGVGGFLAYKNEVDVSAIVAFLLYLSLFYTPITGLSRMLEDLQTTYAGARRVMLILDTPVEVVDKPDAVELGRVEGALSFENVSFHYDNGVPVLKNISFECKPGQMVALVGPTGVGKTTTTQLISRYYEPSEGTIRVDGHDVCSVTLHSLRQNIAPVMQDTFLFNGTIAENIGYANAEAGMDAIVEAARAAQIHEDIMSMPEGYETQVGERGLRLSGGQKQRIAIARAILRKSPIIVLDEATSSVDVETEKKIQSAINAIAGQHTIVTIAHRLSTVRAADLILVLRDGEIVERGDHESLLAQRGLYYEMNLMQSDSARID